MILVCSIIRFSSLRSCLPLSLSISHFLVSFPPLLTTCKLQTLSYIPYICINQICLGFQFLPWLTTLFWNHTSLSFVKGTISTWGPALTTRICNCNHAPSMESFLRIYLYILKTFAQSFVSFVGQNGLLPFSTKLISLLPFFPN